MSQPNKFMVGVVGADVFITGKVERIPIREENALNLAAYIVSVTDVSNEEFCKLLDEIRG